MRVYPNWLTMGKLLPMLVIAIPCGSASAQMHAESMLGRSAEEVTGFLRDRGYNVQPYGADDPSSFKAVFHDRSREYLDGNFTLCNGRVVSSSIGVDPDSEYPQQMALLIGEYGQPTTKVRTAHLKNGDTTYIDFQWTAGSAKIVLSDLPPSPFWATSSPHRTVLLSLDDRAQTCFALPPGGDN